MPMITGEITSPKAWITKMFNAYPPARSEGWVTLARIVLVGPVLKKRQKQVTKIIGQMSGKEQRNKATRKGKPASMARPETRKYEPEMRERSLSPARPPSKVAIRPARHTMAPKITSTGPLEPGLC